MRKKSLPKKRTSKVKRQRDPIPWKYCILTMICGLFLVGGFFWAAKAHFSSMDYGMKNAKLRKQIEDLKAETRRLKLAREVALSPAEIKKAAKKLGLTTMTARNIQVVGKSADKKTNKKVSDKEEIRKDKNKATQAKPDKEKGSKKGKGLEKDKKEKSKTNQKSPPQSFRKDGSYETINTKR